MSTETSPEPDRAQHRLTIAEGLLSSIDGVRSLQKAREFLGVHEFASMDDVVAGLNDVIDESRATLAAAGVSMVRKDAEDEDDDASSATGEDIPVQGHDPATPSYLYVPTRMAEATVVGGQETPYGGATDPAEADAVGPQVRVATKPPGLRESSDWRACRNCVFFDRGCTKYGVGRPGGKPDVVHLGMYPVDRDDICDSWETVSPPEARGQESQVYKDRQLVMEARIAGVLGLSEVKSSAYPDLDRSPKSNWVENTGGLPNYIERIAKHVHYEHGKDISRSIAIAVGVVRRWCHGGSVSARGEAKKGGTEKPVSGVSAKTRAKACAALAEWDAKRAASKAKTAAKKSAKSVAEAVALVEADGFHLLSVDQAQTLIEAVEWEEAGDGSKGFKDPSLAYCERVVNAVEEAYSDWDEWPGGFSPDAMRQVQEGTLELNGATCGALGLDASLVEESLSVFDPVKHPRRRSGEFSDVLGKLASTRPRTAHVLGSIGRGTRDRSKPMPAVQMPARHAIDRQISQQGTEHGHEYPSSLREMFPAVTPVGLAPLHFKAAMAGAGQHDFSVDKAIGDVVSKFPNVKNWDLDGPKSDAKGEHWVVHVTTHGGEEHHIRVGSDGSVGLVDPPTTKSAPTSGHLYGMSELEPTGDSEKPYHMADHTLFAGDDGKVYEKLEHGPHLMTSKKGTPLAAVRILDHSTGNSKLAPAFAVSHYYDVMKPKGQAHASLGGRYKTAAQEKSEAFEASLARPFRGTHTYQPGVMDMASPTVVRGKRIEHGSEVRIVRGGRGQEKLDPLGKLVWVQDKHGNVQSVWKAGLAPKRKRKLSEEVAVVGRTKERLVETLELLESATAGAEIARLRARRDVLATQFARQIEERDFSSERRKQLAAEGKALPNGSYPIESEEDLHNAATLAASGHGDAAAAKALIAKRAAALGVENPLKKKAKKEA